MDLLLVTDEHRLAPPVFALDTLILFSYSNFPTTLLPCGMSSVFHPLGLSNTSHLSNVLSQPPTPPQCLLIKIKLCIFKPPMSTLFTLSVRHVLLSICISTKLEWQFLIFKHGNNLEIILIVKIERTEAGLLLASC